MAMHVIVRVNKRTPEYLEISGTWESERTSGFSVLVPKQPNMTAAESVEYYMLLEENMIASWTWSTNCCGEHVGVLHGQFVFEGRDGRRNYKEVSYSGANKFDL